MSAWVWLAVAVTGALGALARFLVDRLVSARAAGLAFPFGTVTVNTSGSLLLGLVSGLAVEGNLLLIVGAATLGSYTTFSTWMFETRRLAEDGRARSALLNVLVSVAVGLGAVALGRSIGAHL